MLLIKIEKLVAQALVYGAVNIEENGEYQGNEEGNRTTFAMGNSAQYLLTTVMGVYNCTCSPS